MTALRLAAASFAAVSLFVTGCSSNSAPTEPTDTTPNPASDGSDDMTDDDDSAPPAKKLDAGASPAKPATTSKVDAGMSKGDAGPAKPAMPPKSAADAGMGSPTSGSTPDASASVPSAVDASMPAAPKTASCLDGITDYENPGPFKFDTKSAGNVKMWIPAVPAGCKVPVIHMANGTTASCSNYQNAIERMATHGFLTTCYEDPNTGAGTYGIMAFEAALSMYPDLADNKLGSTGHSQGGQAALVTTQLAEAKWGDKMVITGLAMEPASGFGTQPEGGSWQSVYAKIKSPVFMFSGDSSTGYANSSLLGMDTGDGLVAISWVKEGFDALSKSIEAYHWTAIGATHIPTPEEPEEQISIPWFRWKLLGDTKACEFFKKMPAGGKWKSVAEQNPAPCK